MMGKKRLLILPVAFMILMMTLIIFSQLAMEIYAYNFVAGTNMERTSLITLKNYMENKRITEEAASTEEDDEKSKSKSGPQRTAAASVISFVMPVKGGVTTSVYGDTASRNTTHLGHDWAVDVGTKVRAAAAGYVEKAYYSDSYGYNVLVNHGSGMETRYAHLSELRVDSGQWVEQRQVIGLSGSTGDSTGPHLHFEVIHNGKKVNPADYLK